VNPSRSYPSMHGSMTSCRVRAQMRIVRIGVNACATVRITGISVRHLELLPLSPMVSPSLACLAGRDALQPLAWTTVQHNTLRSTFPIQKDIKVSLGAATNNRQPSLISYRWLVRQLSPPTSAVCPALRSRPSAATSRVSQLDHSAM
jgi:hypothetical protein